MFVCRSCGASVVVPVLSLGQIPLANALLTSQQLGLPEEKFPLDLVFCPSCTLLQIIETVSPEKLFREYLYFSSFSETVIQNAREISNRLTVRCNLNKDSRVVEVASNDGYLLRNYKKKGIPILGIEPARNIAKVAEEHGIPTICAFFDENLALEMCGNGQQADVIHANNVIAHVANLHSVIKGIAALLKSDGVAVIENHYAKDMVDHTEFDSIYHEHLCYFSVTSFRNLFAQHGLTLVDVERLPMHGGSLRVYFQRQDGPRSLAIEGARRVKTMLEEEIQWGVTKSEFYQNFGEKVERLRHALLAQIHQIKADRKSIVVYGASAKSTTLLNYFGIGREAIDYVVDRSPVKQGYYTPGTHLSIRSPEELLTNQPDYVLLLTWNFANEILSQQVEYRARGGRFIIPIPELKVV
jgi:SAM-dependent methyltransferase